MILTQELLRKLLSYDPATGDFVWIYHKQSKHLVGQKAGCLHADGRWYIGIMGKQYKAHRLAWLYVTGEWPKDEIDHVNGDPIDNRFSNLRQATHSQNMANRSSSKKSRIGLKGAYRYDSTGSRWWSSITKDGVNYRLGSFDTEQEAHQAWCKAAAELHGEFVRTG